MWQVPQLKLSPAASMCTSRDLPGLASVVSRSPCFTASPPPALKWQAPQVSRLVLPTFCDTLFRSTPGTFLPDLGGYSISL